MGIAGQQQIMQTSDNKPERLEHMTDLHLHCLPGGRRSRTHQYVSPDRFFFCSTQNPRNFSLDVNGMAHFPVDGSCFVTCRVVAAVDFPPGTMLRVVCMWQQVCGTLHSRGSRPAAVPLCPPTTITPMTSLRHSAPVAPFTDRYVQSLAHSNSDVGIRDRRV